MKDLIRIIGVIFLSFLIALPMGLYVEWHKYNLYDGSLTHLNSEHIKGAKYSFSLAVKADHGMIFIDEGDFSKYTVCYDGWRFLVYQGTPACKTLDSLFEITHSK